MNQFPFGRWVMHFRCFTRDVLDEAKLGRVVDGRAKFDGARVHVQGEELHFHSAETSEETRCIPHSATVCEHMHSFCVSLCSDLLMFVHVAGQYDVRGPNHLGVYRQLFDV